MSLADGWTDTYALSTSRASLAGDEGDRFSHSGPATVVRRFAFFLPVNCGDI